MADRNIGFTGPSRFAIHLGPLPLRGYSLMVLLGVVAAIWWGSKRWEARGGERGTLADIAMWAVSFGLVGARLCHVVTSSGPYFGPGSDLVKALYIWDGGIGIWGAIALGALGAWIGCRRIPLPAYADAVAPGIALGQAIGRWGNWFNHGLYGRPTTLPWGLTIAPEHRPDARPRIVGNRPGGELARQLPRRDPPKPVLPTLHPVHRLPDEREVLHLFAAQLGPGLVEVEAVGEVLSQVLIRQFGGQVALNPIRQVALYTARASDSFRSAFDEVTWVCGHACGQGAPK